MDAEEIQELIQKMSQENASNLGLTALAAGPPVYIKLELPKKAPGLLGKSLRFVSNILGKSNAAQEIVGEMATWLIADLMGFENADLPVFPTVHGPDIFAKNQFGTWGMFEAKGGTSRLSTGASYGDQMQWRWINHWYRKLANDNLGQSDDGDQLYSDYRNRRTREPIVAMVVNLNLRRRKDNLKIGIQVWTRNSAQWNNWERTGPNRF